MEVPGLEGHLLPFIIVIGLPLMIPILAIWIKHKERMAQLRASGGETSEAFEKLRAEYQEFVLGADARIHRLEDRIKQLESKLRQSGEPGEYQDLRRG